MEYINRVELSGIIGRSSISNCCGTNTCNFSLMTEYCYKSKDGSVVIDTVWIQVVAFGSNLDVKKGDRIHVYGRLRCRRYTDENGLDHSLYEVVANHLEKISYD